MDELTLLADLELLERLCGGVPPRIQSLRRRVAVGAPGVALVGLFSRGKSTLFNQLAGAALAQVGGVPTTAVAIEASAGPAFAAAYWTDRAEQLPLAADAFKAAVERLGTPRPLRVEFSGHLRLPPGVRLIDTPGVGAVAELDERDWFTAAAGAGALVLAVPPGPQGEDWDLLRLAREVFSDRVAVLLKATSDEPSSEDLAAVAERSRRNSGVDVVVVPSSPPTIGWGEDQAWLPVEGVLEDLQEKARAALLVARDELQRWVGGAFHELTLQHLNDAGRQLVRSGGLAFGVSDTASSTLARLREVARVADEAGDRERQSKELEERQRRWEAVENRRTAGEALYRDAQHLLRLPYASLLEQEAVLYGVIERSGAWYTGAGRFSELSVLEERLAANRVGLIERYRCVSGDRLILQLQSLYSRHWPDRSAQYRQLIDWTERVRQWMAFDDATSADSVAARRQVLEYKLAAVMAGRMP